MLGSTCWSRKDGSSCRMCEGFEGEQTVFRMTYRFLAGAIRIDDERVSATVICDSV